MPKVHIPRKSVSIDMTPMVDMAFLLVTFFMLATKFQPDEPVKINNPKSISTFHVPDANKTTIEVSQDGRVFFNFDGKFYRKALIDNMGRQFNQNFTTDEINTFAIQGSLGVPIAQMKQFLDADPDARKKLAQPGIPVDTINSPQNELRYWITFSRAANPMSTIIIKADNVAQYGVVKRVIATLQNQDINKFSLITSEVPNPLEKKKGGLKL